MSQEAHIMSMLKPEERRRARRHRLNRAAKIKAGAGLLPRDRLITDISDSGARLHAEGYEVPDEFVLLFSDHSVLGRTGLIAWCGGSATKSAPNSSAWSTTSDRALASLALVQ